MRQSKSLWPWSLVICLSFLVQGSPVSASDGSIRPDQSAPQAVIDEAVHGGKLSFAVAALGTAEGELWSHAAGTRDDRGVESASPDNIIQIASMTKLITTIAALQLVEQGLLALDTPIDAYVPELAGLQVLKGFDAEDEAIFEPALRAPTVRELMTHTAGYVYEIWNADAQKAATLGVTESAFTGGNFLASPLAFQPGTAWEYGINTDWLGVLVEKRSGARLATYFADNIFEPLAMADTYFELPEAKLSRTVTVMARIDGKLAPAPMMQPQSKAPGSMPFYSGGGGLYSTVADYGRILQLLLNGGSLDGMTLLKSETVDLMFRNNIGDIQPVPLATLMPTVSNTADMSFGAPATFGLGLLLHPSGLAGGRQADTGSWAGLFNSYYWVDRQSGLYGIFGTQILPFYDADAIATLLDFERAAYATSPVVLPSD